MNVKQEFINWFEPKSPQSYKSWFGKNITIKMDEINDAYLASFDTNLFEIELDSTQSATKRINNNIDRRFDVPNNTFANYNKKSSNGIPQAIIGKWFVRFLADYDGDPKDNKNTDDDLVNKEEVSQINNSFTYEQDLQDSLISQAEELFVGFKIYGSNGEGVEYTINGKRIDLLMKNSGKNKLMAIELKAGKADFRVFGQISMYLQLLEEKFSSKIISGVIIASEIDETLKIASRRDRNIDLLTYKMELKLNIIEK